MDDYLIFATRLKQLREDMGLTQKEFADKVGFTQATLSAYENNPKNPSLSIMISIATKCHVSLDWLCGLSDKKTNSEEIQTYSDLIKMLLIIDKYSEIEMTDTEYEGYQIGPSGYPDYRSDIFSSIIFINGIFDDFIRDWKKMRDFHRTGTIDDDVYNLWIEKSMRKYDIKINKDTPKPRLPFKDEEELPFN